MERHGLLVAHSLSCADQAQVLIQLLNPSAAPVTVKKVKAGILKPLIKLSERECLCCG